jgi:hypothetical protein
MTTDDHQEPFRLSNGSDQHAKQSAIVPTAPQRLTRQPDSNAPRFGADTKVGTDHPKPSYDNIDRIFRATVGRMTKGVSPMAIAEAWLSWVSHLTTSPGRQLELGNL